MQYRFVSADSHVAEPADLWLNYIDPKFRPKAPHLEHQPATDVFVCEGANTLPVGLIAGCRRKDHEVRKEGRYDEDIPRGGYDPHARIKEMEQDGLDAEVVYPTVSMGMFMLEDLEFQKACFGAYNTWVADYCNTYPDRIKGIAAVPLEDIEWAVGELHRTRKLGLPGAMIARTPDGARPYHDSWYDPFWAAAQELGMPVSLHVATERRPKQKTLTEIILNPTYIQKVFIDMVFSGFFDRFPRVKVLAVESDVGWAGNTIERMDWQYTRFRNLRPAGEMTCKRLPSEYFHNNIYYTFLRDASGIAIREVVGLENLMWSSDYPHHISTWPHSREIIERQSKGLPPEHERKIFCDNAVNLYGFKN